MIRFLNHLNAKNLKDYPNWDKYIVILWTEDEVSTHDPSAEHLSDAIVRYAGEMYTCASYFTPDSIEGVHRGIEGTTKTPLDLLRTELDSRDEGDMILHLHERGWVRIYTPRRTQLGRVLDPDSLP